VPLSRVGLAIGSVTWRSATWTCPQRSEQRGSMGTVERARGRVGCPGRRRQQRERDHDDRRQRPRACPAKARCNWRSSVMALCESASCRCCRGLRTARLDWAERGGDPQRDVGCVTDTLQITRPRRTPNPAPATSRTPPRGLQIRAGQGRSRRVPAYPHGAFPPRWEGRGEHGSPRPLGALGKT
jgi:hypothetical protein